MEESPGAFTLTPPPALVQGLRTGAWEPRNQATSRPLRPSCSRMLRNLLVTHLASQDGQRRVTFTAGQTAGRRQPTSLDLTHILHLLIISNNDALFSQGFETVLQSLQLPQSFVRHLLAVYYPQEEHLVTQPYSLLTLHPGEKKKKDSFNSVLNWTLTCCFDKHIVSGLALFCLVIFLN